MMDAHSRRVLWWRRALPRGAGLLAMVVIFANMLGGNRTHVRDEGGLDAARASRLLLETPDARFTADSLAAAEGRADGIMLDSAMGKMRADNMQLDEGGGQIILRGNVRITLRPPSQK